MDEDEIPFLNEWVSNRIATERKLISELFDEVSAEHRCEYVERDNQGTYCGKGLSAVGSVFLDRRFACSIVSLQFFCLDIEGRDKCIYYNGMPFLQPELN